MSISLTSYSEYQETGQEWLGQVPAHWVMAPHRAVFREIIDKGHPDEDMLSVTMQRGVIRQADLLRESSKKDLSNADKSNYKLVHDGDLAYNKMRAWQGALGVSRFRGIISPAYVVVRPRATQNPEFYHYLMRTPAFMTEAERWSYGITSDQWSLRADDFKCIQTVVPPLDEQDAIVRFLRYIDQRVNRLLKTKRRLIELLNEQKQAIIHRAVTRGLNPEVALKPSGVEWLGDVPEHWQVRKVAQIFNTIGSGTTPATADRSYYDNGDIPWIVTGDLKNKEIHLTNKYVTQKALTDYSTLKMFPANSVIVAMYGATIGKVGLLHFPACVNQACCVLANSRFLSPEYTTQLFVAFRDDIVRLGVGGGQPNISQDTIRQLRVPVPPGNEQEAILSNLATEIQPLDLTISKANAEIDHIREYRTRLVSDVVTGQLDVRGLVLPEVGDEVGGLDEDGGEGDEGAEEDGEGVGE